MLKFTQLGLRFEEIQMAAGVGQKQEQKQEQEQCGLWTLFQLPGHKKRLTNGQKLKLFFKLGKWQTSAWLQITKKS